MSKIPYTVDIDNTVCSELGQMRKCITTHDFSLLPALIERVQFHVSAMESGLWSRKNYHEYLQEKVEEIDSGKISVEEFFTSLRKTLEKGDDW